MIINDQIEISDFVKEAQELAQQGKTPMFISENNRLDGVLAVADQLKEDSKSAIFSPKTFIGSNNDH